MLDRKKVWKRSIMDVLYVEPKKNGEPRLLKLVPTLNL